MSLEMTYMVYRWNKWYLIKVDERTLESFRFKRDTITIHAAFRVELNILFNFIGNVLPLFFFT